MHHEACAFAKGLNSIMKVHSDVAWWKAYAMVNKKILKAPRPAARDLVEADLAEIRVVAPGKAAVRECRRLSASRAR